MREQYAKQLEYLHVEMVRMGALCEDAITCVTRILLGETGLQDQLQETAQQIEQEEKDIENHCMRLILKQQPIATDLRTVSSALRMISDMNRIGVQTQDIADICRCLNGKHLECEALLREMAEAAGHMVTMSVDSFVRRDLELVREVVGYDDVVDDLFDRIKKELIGILGQGTDEERGEICIDTLMVTKYLERIGDHASSIATWVEYSITGQRTK
ncbi:MAG: phosphate signaling complex protein PhoU [Clostridiales bacterium]|nr:phosphate signaling complex protein PhoU [Clostridiales bacterium]